jgi:hypothetical protein
VGGCGEERMKRQLNRGCLVYRQRLLSDARGFAQCVCTAFITSDYTRKLKYLSALAKFQIDMANKSIDATFLPVNELTISRKATQYMHQLTTKLDEHCNCRHKDCLTVTLATDWPCNKDPLEERGGDQYACPQCSRQY